MSGGSEKLAGSQLAGLASPPQHTISKLNSHTLTHSTHIPNQTTAFSTKIYFEINADIHLLMIDNFIQMSFCRRIYRKWFCFVHMNHEVNVCNHNLQSNFLFTGFPTLILYWFRIFPEICTSSAWGKLFEGAWRKNQVKIFPQWLAILDCVSILSLLQSCELLAVGSPRRQLWI